MKSPRIYNDYHNLVDIPRRDRLYGCPHCDFEARNTLVEWMKDIRVVVLNPTRYSKPADFIIVSCCPDCGNKSWNHYRLTDHDYIEDQRIAKAVEGEYNRRKDIMEADWQKSLCRVCKNLNKTDTHYLYYWVECGGDTGHCKTECTRFKSMGNKCPNNG